MSTVMIVVGSVRPGRKGFPIAEWVKAQTEAREGVTVDLVDLAQLALPFMDEPEHPSKRAYTKPHTIAWSERVDAADSFIFVTPEYNHSYSPALKNALDFLAREWAHKPVAFVSYGGVSGGTRGVAALDPVINSVGLVKSSATVAIPFVATRVLDGVFAATEKDVANLGRVFTELDALAGALAVLR